MPDASIVVCPKCGSKIPLTEAFTHEIEDKLRSQFDAELKKKDADHQKLIEGTKREYREILNREIAKMETQAKQQAQEALSLEMKDLKDQLQDKSKQLDTARQQELELRKKQRELEEKELNLQLELQRTLDAERGKIRDEASRHAAEEQRLRVAEKDKQLEDLHRQIEDLKRKTELTSQQMQGEVQEIELEAILSEAFRYDIIEPVAKGMRGADAIQNVNDEIGHFCGKIIWESKRTKAWSDGWVQKLKDDQRQAKADIAVLVSSTLPKDVNRFGCYDGIWVTDFASVVQLAAALRINLIQVAYARNAVLSKNDKMELIYNYLTGNEFKQRVEAIVESFSAMRHDLDAEKRAMERLWAKREKQIERVMQNTTGMHGDLQGIIGKALPAVNLLELPSGESDD